MQGAPNQTHSLMKWIDAAICTMWTKAGEFLDSVSKWHTYAELTQVVSELGMRQGMFNLNAQSPDDERFTGCIQDAVLTNAPPTYFGSLPAVLTPYLGHPVWLA